MFDQLLMDFMADDLDLSFEADQHELDCCCLPSLAEDSFASSTDTRDADDCSEVTPIMDEERMEIDDDDDLCSTVWETKLEKAVPDIQWDPSSTSLQAQQHESHDSFPHLFGPTSRQGVAVSARDSALDIEWVPAEQTSSRSLQDEYERSRQKLVLSMMRSQETRRYVAQQWKQPPNHPDLRDEMITEFSSRKRIQNVMEL